MKTTVRISWNKRVSDIELRVRRQTRAFLVVPFPAPPGLILPGGRYLDFPVSSGVIEVKLDLDLERLRVDRDVAWSSFTAFASFFDLYGRPRGSWVAIYGLPDRSASTRLHAKTFGIRVTDREPTVEDLFALAKILDLPQLVSKNVIALTRQALGYPSSLAFQYKIDQAKTYRDLLRLFLGQVPPFLEFYRTIGPSPLYCLDDPNLAGLAELAEEAYRVAVLGQEGGQS